MCTYTPTLDEGTRMSMYAHMHMHTDYTPVGVSLCVTFTLLMEEGRIFKVPIVCHFGFSIVSFFLTTNVCLCMLTVWKIHAAST